MIPVFKAMLAAGAIATANFIPGVVFFADTAADEDAILGIWSTYTEARVSGDAETWLGLWDEEGRAPRL